MKIKKIVCAAMWVMAIFAGSALSNPLAFLWKTVLTKGGVEAELKEGILVNVKSGKDIVLKEFGRTFVNEKGKFTRDLPLEPFVLNTEKAEEKGDLFYTSDGIMRIKGDKFLGEFGRVWSARKTGQLELTFHPTYFNQKWNTPDRERPLHLDVTALVDKRLWAKALVELDGRKVKADSLKSFPVNATKVFIPASDGKYLAIIPFNMPDSFVAEELGENVEIRFSDQNAQTTWQVLSDCPSCRISLKVETGEAR